MSEVLYTVSGHSQNGMTDVLNNYFEAALRRENPPEQRFSPLLRKLMRTALEVIVTYPVKPTEEVELPVPGVYTIESGSFGYLMDITNTRKSRELSGTVNLMARLRNSGPAKAELIIPRGHEVPDPPDYDVLGKVPWLVYV